MAALAVTATPVRTLAPPSWASEKWPPNSAPMVWPVLGPASSATAVRLTTEPLMMAGASLTSVTSWLSTTVPVLIAVAPPLVEVLIVAPLPSAPYEVSIRRTVRVGAAPLKSAAGAKRSGAVAFSPTAAAAEVAPISAQVEPFQYCHWPVALLEPLATTATPAKVLVAAAPGARSALSSN